MQFVIHPVIVTVNVAIAAVDIADIHYISIVGIVLP